MSFFFLHLTWIICQPLLNYCIFTGFFGLVILKLLLIYMILICNSNLEFVRLFAHAFDFLTNVCGYPISWLIITYIYIRTHDDC